MKLNNQVPLQRLVGKIDNDFNISESDWIPRVAAWTIDALSQMKVLPMERKRRRLEVSGRIATFPCELNASEIKVFDKNECEIEHLDKSKNSCNCSASGVQQVQEIAVFDSSNKTGVNFMEVAKVNNSAGKNFVLDCNNIELNFDTDYIEVETFEVATYYDEYYDCDVPYIYEDGLLLEALAWYCLFKYLSRGSKHPVYDLKSNSPVTNPWLQWNALRPKAANSVKKAISADMSGWNNFFYNSTFRPRG